MKATKTAQRAWARKVDREARRRALLSAIGKDVHRSFWALEFFERREAVARWRGQPGCTIREVIMAINALPT